MLASTPGNQIPHGTVKVSGAKNAATRLLAATLLTDEPVHLSNFPTQLVDANHKFRFIRELGTNVESDDSEDTVLVTGQQSELQHLTPEGLDVPIRTTYLLAAGQLARTGRAMVPYPGGCAIGGGPAGGRGYDLHIQVWEAFGCRVTEAPTHIEVVGNLAGGAVVDFPISTVGGTETALLMSVVANGVTNISNAYITPEVLDLIQMLRAMGAQIEVYGTSRIRVSGRGQLLSGAHYAVMPDRIEALTWMVYAAISAGDIRIDGVPFDTLDVPLTHLRATGVDFLSNSQSVQITPDCLKGGGIQPFEVACGTHPGVISDMQALFVLLALKAEGRSRIFDYRYPDRIAFADELAKLTETGAIRASTGQITVTGPVNLKGGTVDSTDLRGSMAVLLAALCAQGPSTVDNVQMALRGYNQLDRKLRNLGIQLLLEDA